jgi:hypothetical protein
MLYFVYSILCVCAMYSFITAVDKYKGTHVSVDIVISTPYYVYWPSRSLKTISTVGVVMPLVNTSLGSGVTRFVLLSWGFVLMIHWLQYRVLLMIPSMCLCV